MRARGGPCPGALSITVPRTEFWKLASEDVPKATGMQLQVLAVLTGISKAVRMRNSYKGQGQVQQARPTAYYKRPHVEEKQPR